LINPPPGCPFAPRCAQAMPICRQCMPEERDVSADHWVRCHLFDAG
jgi:peptide/nickel transport system ATP-binding protein